MVMTDILSGPRPLRRGGLCRTGVGGLAVGAIVWSAVGASPALAAGSPVADLVERVSPAVVTVYTTQAVSGGEQGDGTPFGVPEGSPFEEFFKRFGPEGMPGMPGMPDNTPRQGLGSGFVFDAEGYIITNHHVVDGASEVKVRFADQVDHAAEVIGTDPQSDVALLKIDAEEPLPYLKLGDSDKVRVGEDVVAVGNPFGLGGTVTRGIVSAVARDINAGPYVDFIQTDAAINRGNSGGPLFDMDGNVIGVNSAICSPSGGNVGVGFAIPSNIVQNVVTQLRDDGSVSRGWLGVSIQSVTPDIATALGLDEAKGALVANVVQDAPSQGKLETGDVILAYDGAPVDSSRDLPRLVAATEAGATVDIDVLRDGGRRTINVQVGELPADQMAAVSPEAQPDGEGAASEKLGATVAALSAEARQSLGIDESVNGAVVTSLKSGGAAAEAGLRVGDVIVRVGDKDVKSAQELDAAISGTGKETALLLVNRRGSQLFMSVKVEA
jgi:serine protease Do